MGRHQKTAKDRTDLFMRYSHATGVLFVLLVYVLTILYLLGHRKNAAVYVSKTLTMYLLYTTVYVLSVVPVIWSLWQAVRFLRGLSGGRHRTGLIIARNILLLLGVVSAHAVSITGLNAGTVSKSRCLTLLLYDLIFLDFVFYIRTDRKVFTRAVHWLSVVIWLSAVYGIIEHFAGSRLPLLYTVEDQNRVNAIYSNPIPAGSIWLMGLWFPLPWRKRWQVCVYRLVYIAAIIFTLSKNAWIGLAFSCLLYGLVHREYLFAKSRRTALAVTGTLALTAGCVVMLLRGSRFLAIVAARWTNVQTQGSFYARWNHITDTVKYLINEAPFKRLLFGYGFGTSPGFIRSSAHYYGVSVIDNQYITFLYEFGLLALICLLIWAVAALLRIGSKDPLVRSGSMGLAAMFFPLATYEPFTWLPVTYILLFLSVIVLCAEEVKLKATTVMAWCRGMIAGAVIFLLCPAALSWGKSVRQALMADLGEGWNWPLRIISALVLLCILLCLVRALFGKRKIRSLAVMLCITAGITGIGQIALGRAKLSMQSIMQQEEAVLKTVVSAAKGPVYSDIYPWLYDQKYNGIRTSVFTGEDAALADETTLIVDRDYISGKLFSRGFLYTEISDAHGLYTGDASVIASLQDSGIHLSGYYPLERMMDEHTWFEAGKYEIIIRGNASGFSETAGDVFEKLPDTLTLQLTSCDTGAVLGKKTAEPQDWQADEDGRAVTYFAVMIEDAGWYGLEITGEEETLVLDVSYRLTPDYDIHTTYNPMGRKVKEAYFALSGEPVLNTEGYHAVDYVYNKKGYNTEQRFTDILGEPVITAGGCAILRRKYGDTGRLLREEWRGADGKLVINASGYAVSVRDYFDDGCHILVQYLDTKKEAVLIGNGYAAVLHTYDERGRLIRDDYYGTDGQPVILTSGMAAVTWTYDDNGNILAIHYLGISGEPVLTSGGYARVTREYDNDGELIEETLYDLDGEKVESHG